MTTVAVREGTAAVAVPDAVLSLADWAQQLDAAMRIAKAVCTTTFVPKHFQGKPEEAAAAILTGHELGLGPMASLRIFYNINGRNEMYAEAKVAILTSHGHRVWTVERTDESVTVAGRRKGEEHVESITITIEQAKKAGWTSNAAYGKTPQDMLYARAAGRVCRLVAPELLHGIATVGDPDEPPPLKVEATVGAAAAAAPAPLTAADIIAHADAETAVIVPEPERAKPVITDAQSRKMFGLLRQLEKGDKDIALVYIAGVVDREVESTKDLTVEEAGKIIDQLQLDVAKLNVAEALSEAAKPGGDA